MAPPPVSPLTQHKYKAQALQNFIAVHQTYLGAHRTGVDKGAGSFQVAHRFQYTDAVLTFLETHDIEEPVLECLEDCRWRQKALCLAKQQICVLHGLSFDQVAGALPITAADTVEVPPEQIVAQHLRKVWEKLSIWKSAGTSLYGDASTTLCGG